jgi:integrase
MASYDFNPRTGKARVFFRLGGRQLNKMVLAESDRAAARICALIEETLEDVERGKLTMPQDADPIAFILSGGKVTGRPIDEPTSTKAMRLGDLFDLYRNDPPPHLEDSTRKMQETHFRRLLEICPRADLQSFDKAAAQSYISRRAKQTYRKRPIQSDTIAKELQTFRQAWSWVASRSRGITSPPFTLKELRFPKAREKLPFMSYSEIERAVKRGGLSEEEIGELWDCVWLDTRQVRECLDHVKEAAVGSFIFPMFCFTAFTGARRSELCRSRIGDWRFDEHTVKLRQKKRNKDKTFTYRDVPLHPHLAEVMRGWFSCHPGGQYAICQPDGGRLSWNAASYHFEKTLKGSEWAVVRGFHVLRHSFASNLATAGVDQRKIDRWMGHSTDIKWRYQHLRPEDQLDAIGVL